MLALALLAFMAIMGTAYVRFMDLETQEADFDLARLRAHEGAQAGMYAALAQLSDAYAEGQAHFLTAEPQEFTFPVYRRQSDSGRRGFSPDERRRTNVRVTVSDENAKINLNTAPAPVIAAVLDVDDETAEAIVAAQPRGDGVKPASLRPADAEGKARQWLFTLEDLRKRGLLTAEQFEQVDRELVTTFSTLPFDDAAESLNVNRAPARVLAIALGIDPEKARELVAYRQEKPFRNAKALQLAAGKKRADFPITGKGATPDIPGTRSHCFRLMSQSIFVHDAEDGSVLGRAHARVEGVVRFNDDGSYETIYWNSEQAKGNG